MSDFFPFGVDNGDTELEPGDDNNIQLSLSVDFVFYNVPYTTIYVSETIIILKLAIALVKPVYSYK